MKGFTHVLCLLMQEFVCNKCERPGSRDSSERRACCNKCTSKRVLCNKLFGKWPIAGFAQLSPELQTDFWKAEGLGQDGIFVDLSKTITTHRVKTSSDLHQGKYLPLSVYERQGYDVKRILAECTDTEEHPLLGTTYRVDIHCISCSRT